MNVIFILWMISINVIQGHTVRRYSKENGKLLLVHMIVRPGQQFPNNFYPNDPYKDRIIFPNSLGSLTRIGKNRMYGLGQKLRVYYHDAIGLFYTPEIVQTRSKDTLVARMSTQLILTGFFPPTNVQMWKRFVTWQPFLVDYKEKKDEDIFQPVNCRYRDHIRKLLPDSPQMREKYLESETLLANISRLAGYDVKDFSDVMDLYLNLNAEANVDIPFLTPDFWDGVFPEPMYEEALKSIYVENSDPILKQINSGYLLTHIIVESKKKFCKKITERRRLYLYVGDETTIGYLTNALNLTETHLPQYGAVLIFEFYEKNNTLYMKIKYLMGIEYSPQLTKISIPQCEDLCPVDKFVEIYKDMFPKQQMASACSPPPWVLREATEKYSQAPCKDESN